MFLSEDGFRYEFNRDNFIDIIIKNEKLKKEVYQKICDVLIMKYRSTNDTLADTDSVQFVGEDEESTNG